MHFRIILLLTFLPAFFFTASKLLNCNEAVCASLVSKCMLIKSCGCDMQNNCTCCKDCYKCLQNLYTECCSCVGMCPDSLAQSAQYSLKSSIEDLPSSMHELFDVLTTEDDPFHRWTLYKYPIFEDLEILTPDWPKFKSQISQSMQKGAPSPSKIKPDSTLFLNDSSIIFVDSENELSIDMENNDTDLYNMNDLKNMKREQLEVDSNKDLDRMNCTVLYMSDCMSMHKCRMTCSSMGASKYRWFHNACCQCVGHTCLSYGKNESKCQSCPKSKEELRREYMEKNRYHQLEDEL